MVEIGNTLVSFQLFETYFLCPLHICKGECCIEGDAGAPLLEQELEIINDLLPKVYDYLSPKAQKVLEEQGAAYYDDEGDLVTSIVDGKECVFTYLGEDGVCGCVFDKLYREGKIGFQKPVSCHLYPVRITEFESFTAVNLHRWSICDCAVKYGKEHGLPAYKFLKEPLIRHFGEEWYKELEKAADDYERAFNHS